MTGDPGSDLDRAIDEVLASVVAGEPRRVNARSVRQALNESQASRLPLWLAVAAVLALGFVLSIRPRGPISEAPALATNRPTVEKLSPPGSIPASAGVTKVASSPRSVRGTDRFERFDEPRGSYEGLPRLTIASIELPEPFSTIGLEADAIQIPRIEIAPLFVSALSLEQEHDQ